MSYAPCLPLRWSFHALERYDQHHPGTTGDELCSAVCNGEEESTGVAAALLGRRTPSHDTIYVRAPDSRGLFALVRNGNTLLVTTYLRFGEVQRRVARGESPGLAGEEASDPDPVADLPPPSHDTLRTLAEKILASAKRREQASLRDITALAEGLLRVLNAPKEPGSLRR